MPVSRRPQEICPDNRAALKSHSALGVARRVQGIGIPFTPNDPTVSYPKVAMALAGLVNRRLDGRPAPTIGCNFPTRASVWVEGQGNHGFAAARAAQTCPLTNTCAYDHVDLALTKCSGGGKMFDLNGEEISTEQAQPAKESDEESFHGLADDPEEGGRVSSPPVPTCAANRAVR